MREEIKDKDRLLHILESICNITEFMHSKTATDLNNDKLLFFGVVKNIEIIGEAAYMLTPMFKELHKDTPWQDIISMRHVLVHGYYTASPRFIWDTVQNDLQPLKVQIEQYLSEMEETK